MSLVTIPITSRMRIRIDEEISKLTYWAKDLEEDSYICGGYLRDLLIGKEPHDIDIFFTIPNEQKRWEKIEQITSKLLQSKKMQLLSRTENAVTIGWKAHPPIQLVAKIGEESLEDILDHFDFSVCMVGTQIYRYSPEDIYATPRFYTDMLNKQLYYTGSSHPGASLIRLVKFMQKGFTPDLTSLYDLINDIHDSEDDDLIAGFYQEIDKNELE